MNDPRLSALGDEVGSDVCGCSRALLDVEYARSVHEEARARYEEAIVSALGAGLSQRSVGRAAGLSHVGVKRLADRVRRQAGIGAS